MDKAEIAKSIIDIRRLQQVLINFNHAYKELNSIWASVSVESLGSEEYPFDKSFDEYDVKSWSDSFIEELNNEIKVLQGGL